MSVEQNIKVQDMVPRTLFEKLYVKILATCGHPKAPWILGILSLTESCCFIIPPEVLLFPMSYAKRKHSFRYAAITTITSVMGAVLGYYMGIFLWAELKPYAFEYISGFAKYFEIVGQKYQENAVGALFLAAFTPIPFKVFTVAAGVWSEQISLITLILTSLVGRGARYYIMAGLVYFLGERAQEIIEKHFKTFTILTAVFGVLLIIFLKMRH